MKNFLAVDTSAEYMTVIACKEGAAHTVLEPACAMQHSVRLMDAVDEALQRAGLSPRACECFCAVTGPGSFTGIRIGISCAKGFAAACGAPTLGVTAFRLAAYTAEGKVLAALPAGRGSYYVCGFYEGKEVLAPACVGEEELKNLAREYAVYSAYELPVPHTRIDPAAGLLGCVLSARPQDCGELGAVYVRRSQAEISHNFFRADERNCRE